MRRRRGIGRRGPGLVGTVARTAVVAGTATAVYKGVGGAMDGRSEAQEQEAAADQAAFESQQQVQELQSQMDAMQAQQAQQAMAAQAPPPADNDLMTQLQQLAQLKDAGVLTDEEFTAAKAKLLGT